MYYKCVPLDADRLLFAHHTHLAPGKEKDKGSSIMWGHKGNLARQRHNTDDTNSTKASDFSA